MLGASLPSLSMTIMSLTWCHVVEMTLLIIACYQLLSWLEQDRAPLLEYFCSIYFSMTLMYFLNFVTISWIAWHMMPFLGMLLVIFHQHALQKHYVTWQTKNRTHTSVQELPQQLMQLTLRAIDKNVPIVWIIEQHDALDPYFMGSSLQAPLTPHLMELIITALQQPQQYIWITTAGIVREHNPHLIIPHEHLSYTPEVAALPPLLQKLHVLSSQHDCIIVQSIPQDRTITILHRGITSEKLSTHHCLNRLQQLLTLPNSQEHMTCSFSRVSADRSQHASPGPSL